MSTHPLTSPILSQYYSTTTTSSAVAPVNYRITYTPMQTTYTMPLAVTDYGYTAVTGPQYIDNTPQHLTYETLPESEYVEDYTNEWSGLEKELINPVIRPSTIRNFESQPGRLTWEQIGTLGYDNAAAIPAVNIKVDIGPEGLDWIGSSRPFKVGDIVNTPMGKGIIYVIDDGVYCVELDPASNILHEFNMEEIKRHEL